MSRTRSSHQSETLRSPDWARVWQLLPEQNRFPVVLAQSLLFGTQAYEQYRPKDELKVKRSLRQQGWRYLEQNPVSVVAMELWPGQAGFVLLDGHHRARYAPGQGFTEVPAEVTSVETLAQAGGWEEGWLTQIILSGIDTVFATFGRRDFRIRGTTWTPTEPVQTVAGVQIFLAERQAEGILLQYSPTANQAISGKIR